MANKTASGVVNLGKPGSSRLSRRSLVKSAINGSRLGHELPYALFKGALDEQIRGGPLGTTLVAE
jgi:hypothetical protein